MKTVDSEGKVVAATSVPAAFKLFDNDAIIRETSSGSESLKLNMDSCSYEFSQNKTVTFSVNVA
jgi:hypothetical protein